MTTEKIFHRPTLPNGTTQHEYPDIRKRNITIAFRVTEQERDQIYSRIYASGMDKSTFFIESCLYQNILVRGNIKSFSHILDEFERIVKLLTHYPVFSELPTERLEAVRTIAEILIKRFRSEQPL